MNISKKLPPMPIKSSNRLQSALQKILNQDNSLFKIVPKPLSKQSAQTIQSDNQQVAVLKYRQNRQRKLSIEKMIPRCRSSKNISADSRKSISSQKSITKLSKNQITGRQMANLPYITAKSWALFQISTNRLIYGKKQDIRREVASLTKISNLITILEILAEFNLDENKILVKVTRQAASMNGTTAQIKQGMIICLKDLFYGMMLPSGNDAAYMIAQVGGTIVNIARQNQKLLSSIVYNTQLLSQSIQKHNNNVIIYLNRMNTIAKFKAKTINTSFANPHGLSNVNSLSTAEDMARLSAYGIKNDKFRKVVETKLYPYEYTLNLSQEFTENINDNNLVSSGNNQTLNFFTSSQINDENIDPNIIFQQEKNVMKNRKQKYCKIWQNTNKMLWRGFSGIKTGITPNAGPCLSASVKKTIQGKQYQFVMILLKSFSMETRWKQVQGLAQWGFQLMTNK